MVRRALPAAFILCLIQAVAAFATVAETELKAWMVKQSDVTKIEGRFLQHRETPLLAEPLISAGTFRLERPNRVRWMIENPEALVLELEGDRIRAGRPGQLHTLPSMGAAAGLQEMTDLLLGGRGVPVEQFHVIAGPVAHSFELTPRTPDRGTGLARLVLVLDADQEALSEVVLVSADGDTSKIRFLDVVLHREVAEKRP